MRYWAAICTALRSATSSPVEHVSSTLCVMCEVSGLMAVARIGRRVVTDGLSAPITRSRNKFGTRTVPAPIAPP